MDIKDLTIPATEIEIASLNEQLTPEGKMILRRLALERDILFNYKQSVLAVEREWNCQNVARLLGINLGESIRAQIESKITKLIAEKEKIQKDRNEVYSAIQSLFFAICPDCATDGRIEQMVESILSRIKLNHNRLIEENTALNEALVIAKTWLDGPRFQAPQSCGMCGLPDSCCDMDCVESNCWSRDYGKIRSLAKPTSKEELKK